MAFLTDNWEIILIFCGIGILAFFIFLGRLGWVIFSDFRKLKKLHPEYLEYRLTIGPDVSVKQVSNFPEDRKRIVLSSYLFDEIEDELHDSGSDVFMVVLFVFGLSVFFALFARSVGVLNVEFGALAAVTFGFSEFVALILVLIKLDYLSKKVRHLLK